MQIKEHRISIKLDEGRSVSGITMIPDNMKALMVLGHGAGAGMEHRFMTSLAKLLFHSGIGTLRYNFPYIEQGRRSPSSPAISMATVRAVVVEANHLFANQLLLVGGKSYGGRMSSQAQSNDPLPGVAGLVFYGFPLHAPGKPGNSRGNHLAEIEIPLLFLQGSRDKLADLSLMTPLVDSLGGNAKMEILQGADHSFNMLKSAPKSSAEILAELARITSDWTDNLT